MDPSARRIVRAEPADTGRVASLAAEAFAALPIAGWLIPDAAPDRRHTVLAAWFAVMVEHALDAGHVDVFADFTAVAVWRYADLPVPPPDLAHRPAASCARHADRFAVLDDLLARHRPAQPHHHLALLAVAPPWQRTGRGARLLAHHHQWLDRAGLPAHVHACGTAARRLYLRHHYATAHRSSLPDGTPVAMMWRPPRMATEPGS